MNKSNSKVLIIYKSKYGSTKQYAEWIADEIKSELISVKNMDNQIFVNYDMIIFGGYFYLERINIANLIIKNWDMLKNKKIILFTTSGTPPTENYIKEKYHSTFPEIFRQKIQYFPLGGKMDFNQFTLFDKFLMKIGRMMTKDPVIKEMMGNSVDEVKKENLKPLLEYLKRELKDKH